MLSPVRIVVVGCDSLAGRAFRRLATRLEIAIGQLSDVGSAVGICQRLPGDLLPHAIVVASQCLLTPDQQGLCTLMEIAPVIVLGTDPSPDTVLEALRLGARGHVDWPREADDRLEGVLWTVLAGRPALSPLITLRILEQLHRAAPPSRVHLAHAYVPGERDDTASACPEGGSLCKTTTCPPSS